MFWRISSATIATLSLLACSQSDWPPQVLQATSDRGADSIQECVGSPEGKKEFPGLSYVLVGAPYGPPPSNYMFVASDGTWIQIYSELRGPNVIVVRSTKPLNDGQARFVRGCTT